MKYNMTEFEYLTEVSAQEYDYPKWICRLIRVLTWLNRPRIFLGKVKA